ncbi:MAG: KAP family NTPase, partial [Propionibacteriaceae bacterium]|nr:KAP family NTPase [Propionibacteriaceae bacterium]
MRGQASSKNADEWVPEKVNDEAIIFQDGEWVLACEDSLGRKALAEHIAGAIPGLRPPFTVAIYGGWGEGKTHLLKSVEREIKEIGESAKADEKYQTVWFDLWQHQNDVNPVVSMLQVARDKLNDNGNFAEIAKTVGEVLTACLV